MALKAWRLSKMPVVTAKSKAWRGGNMVAAAIEVAASGACINRNNQKSWPISAWRICNGESWRRLASAWHAAAISSAAAGGVAIEAGAGQRIASAFVAAANQPG
jgi:hypothetical protein